MQQKSNDAMTALVKQIIDLSIARLINAVDLDGQLDYKLEVSRARGPDNTVSIDSSIFIDGSMHASSILTLGRLAQFQEKVD